MATVRLERLRVTEFRGVKIRSWESSLGHWMADAPGADYPPTWAPNRDLAVKKLKKYIREDPKTRAQKKMKRPG